MFRFLPRLSSRLALGSAAGTLLLFGCSDMKFVNSSGPETTAYDNRRDIRLTGVATLMTSGSALIRRVEGEAAVYSEDRGRLELDKASVEMYRENGALQGATTAQNATVFMSDQPDGVYHRGDFAFGGNFRYRSPAEKDPTTDALTLSTERLRWDERKQVYSADTPYQMISYPPGKGPMVLRGEKFEATSDLRSFRMGGGSVSSDPADDPRQQLQSKGKQIQEDVDSLAARYKPGPLPRPLEIPETTETLRIGSMLEQAEQLQRSVGERQ